MTTKPKTAPPPVTSGFCDARPWPVPDGQYDPHRMCHLTGCACPCHVDQLTPPGAQHPIPARVKVPLACLQGRHTADCGHEPSSGTAAAHDSSPAPDAATSEPPAPPVRPVTDEGDNHRPASAGEELPVAPVGQDRRDATDLTLEEALGPDVSTLTPRAMHDGLPYASPDGDVWTDMTAALAILDQGPHNHTFTPADLVCRGCGGYTIGRKYVAGPVAGSPHDTSGDLSDEERRIIVAAHLELRPEAAYDAVRAILAGRGT